MPSVRRSWMFLVCLVAAAAGTPLRQAEAADDIARTLGEAEAGEYDIEVVDGGVGDDVGETVLDRGAEGVAHALLDSIPPAPPYLLAPPTAPAHPVRVDRARGDPGSSPAAGSARCHAWLQ